MDRSADPRSTPPSTTSRCAASVTTDLGDDIAFTTPAGTTCMTDAKHGSPALACLVEFTNPPPRPQDIYGQWKGGWVDFDGGSVQVGSAHGDPGRFANGQGRELPYDTSLSFGDYRCRTDASALFCVNYAKQSAVRLSADGVDTYACARQVTPPPESACSTSASARAPDRRARRRCPVSGWRGRDRVRRRGRCGALLPAVRVGSMSSSASA